MLNLIKQFEDKNGRIRSGSDWRDFSNDLQKKLEDIHDMCYEHDELPDGYYDIEAIRRDETLNEIIKRIEQ